MHRISFNLPHYLQLCQTAGQHRKPISTRKEFERIHLHLPITNFRSLSLLTLEFMKICFNDVECIDCVIVRRCRTVKCTMECLGSPMRGDCQTQDEFYPWRLESFMNGPTWTVTCPFSTNSKGTNQDIAHWRYRWSYVQFSGNGAPQ